MMTVAWLTQDVKNVPPIRGVCLLDNLRYILGLREEEEDPIFLFKNSQEYR